MHLSSHLRHGDSRVVNGIKDDGFIMVFVDTIRVLVRLMNRLKDESLHRSQTHHRQQTPCRFLSAVRLRPSLKDYRTWSRNIQVSFIKPVGLGNSRRLQARFGSRCRTNSNSRNIRYSAHTCTCTCSYARPTGTMQLPQP